MTDAQTPLPPVLARGPGRRACGRCGWMYEALRLQAATRRPGPSEASSKNVCLRQRTGSTKPFLPADPASLQQPGHTMGGQFQVLFSVQKLDSQSISSTVSPQRHRRVLGNCDFKRNDVYRNQFDHRLIDIQELISYGVLLITKHQQTSK